MSSSASMLYSRTQLLGALGAARIPPVTCRFRGPFHSSPVVRSLPLHYHIHLPSEPRDTVPYGDESVIRRHSFGLSFLCLISLLLIFLLSKLLPISTLYTQYYTTMATTAEEATLPAALLLVDSTTKKKKKKKSKKTSVTATTTITSILQQQLDATADTGSDMVPTPPFTFAQAVKEFNDAQEAGEDSKEVLTRFWRHTYRLGEDDGRFEVSREMEQTGYQQGYDAALAKFTAAGHRVEGECTAGWQARVDAEASAVGMEDNREAFDEAFRRGKEAGLDEGKRAGYCDGFDEGRLEAEKGALELFFEGCSAGKKEGITKEKEAWIRQGHAELGACRAGREDLVDAAIMVGTSTCSFTDTAVATDPGDNSSSEKLLFAKSEPFSWAEDASSIPIHSVELVISSPPPPRDISCLSSGAQKPFASLQHRSKRNFIQQQRSTGHSRSRYQVPVHQHFPRQSSRLSAPSRRDNTFTTQVSSLDWTGDPRLFRLQDALEDLGWFRR